MRLDWLTLAGFRSYDRLEWQPDPGVNVIVGRNGAGKTNLLEAVGYLGSLRSFRGAPDHSLIDFDAERAYIRGQITSGSSEALIELELRGRGGRQARVNTLRLARTSDLLGHVRFVTFLPEDLDIVKRGPGYRRDFLDATAVQLWPGSHLDQADFERALRQRNAFLKQNDRDDVTLGVWDERLAHAGGKVMARRARTVDAIRDHVSAVHADISQSEVSVVFDYVSGWKGELDARVSPAEFAQRLSEALSESRRRDRERRVTTVGPHRDEPILLLDGHDSRFHASQGEQRTLTLSLRVASHRAITDLIDRAPILLLDDVYSELDPERSAALTRALPEAQTLVTTADPEDVPLEGVPWGIEGGEVVRG
ncbi:MAG TPA: DNA replication/repair protein RecF [Acidimicrobiia bacterium]